MDVHNSYWSLGYSKFIGEMPAFSSLLNLLLCLLKILVYYLIFSLSTSSFIRPCKALSHQVWLHIPWHHPDNFCTIISITDGKACRGKCFCHFALKVKVLVSQSGLTLFDSMNCSLSSSSVHGIFQVRILEWVAIPFSRGSAPSRVSHSAGRFLYHLSH